MPASDISSPPRNLLKERSYRLEDMLIIKKQIGDGSFGYVSSARVRTGAKRNSSVAVKTMKKTYADWSKCRDLREVIFLKAMPEHLYLVSTLDMFLDPSSHKLHIVMEKLDGNLYQLIKCRDEHKKYFDSSTVKDIMTQITSGLDHIHKNNFFHRDIKPENILVGTGPTITDTASTKEGEYTPPATPPPYTVKIADFGLARHINLMAPYTTYVSTRWYRAPEVLLRAGAYSSPVDIWGLGAMAAEIATLRPLFPGGNEVDQVWRICEVVGSPGDWCNRQGNPIGGGKWGGGKTQAGKLGFSFPKMAPAAPMSIEKCLESLGWAERAGSFAELVSWCLQWDPKNRPTATQILQHDFLVDESDRRSGESATASDASHHDLDDVAATSTRQSIRLRHPPSPEPSPEPLEYSLDAKHSRLLAKRHTRVFGQAANASMHKRQVPSTNKTDLRQMFTPHNNCLPDDKRAAASHATVERAGSESPLDSSKVRIRTRISSITRLFAPHQASVEMDEMEENPGCMGWVSNSNNRHSLNLDHQPASISYRTQQLEHASTARNARISWKDYRDFNSLRMSTTSVPGNRALKRQSSLPASQWQSPVRTEGSTGYLSRIPSKSLKNTAPEDCVAKQLHRIETSKRPRLPLTPPSD